MVAVVGMVAQVVDMAHREAVVADHVAVVWVADYRQEVHLIVHQKGATRVVLRVLVSVEAIPWEAQGGLPAELAFVPVLVLVLVGLVLALVA